MELILTEEEIEQENTRMFLETATMVALLSYPQTISGSQLKSWIIEDSLPDDTIDIHILKNRNIRIVPENIDIKKAIVIRKSTLRFLPTTKTFYSSKICEENIATGLSYATPVLVLHVSKDTEWVYVQSYYYRGWLMQADISYLDDSTFQEFLYPEKFITTIEKECMLDNISIDMGVKLPLLANHTDFYEILIPTKSGVKIERININFATIGYLPLTKDNIINQAYKYIDTPYSWGGTNSGIDCSLLMVNIFKVFGLLFPRDTSEQVNVVGLQQICLKGKTEEEKKDILETLPIPFLLFKQGHVLLGIASDTVLHAYGDAGKVFISKLNNSCNTNLYPYLTSIAVLYKKKD